MKAYFIPLMKVITLVGVWGLCSVVRADLIGYDAFDDIGAPAGASGGAFWGYSNVAPVGQSIGRSSWETAPGFDGTSTFLGGKLYTADGGVIRKYAGPSLTEENNSSIGDYGDSRKVYYRTTMTRGTGVSWCGLSSLGNGPGAGNLYERLFFGLYPDGTGRFSIYNQNTSTPIATSTRSVNVGETYLLVVKIDFDANLLALYVNPNLDVLESANTPVVSAPYLESANTKAVRLGSGGTGLTAWEDITVSTTWESLRTHAVTNFRDGGLATSTLRDQLDAASISGGRVTFPYAGAVFAATTGNRIYRFRRDEPGTIESDLPITGLQAGESIRGIEFGGISGELFGVASNSSGTARLYKINPLTGAAAAVSAATFSVTPTASQIGLDFDPILSSLRVTVGHTGRSFQVSITGGHVLAEHPTMAFASGASGIPHVAGLAYSPVSQKIASTTLYGYQLQGGRGGIVRISRPGQGSASDQISHVTPIAPVSDLLIGSIGFDITDDGFALLSGATTAAPGSPLLYEVNLTTGAIRQIGNIGIGPSPIVGLSAAPSIIRLQSGSFLQLVSGKPVVIEGPKTSPGLTIIGSNVDSTLVVSGTSISIHNLNFTGGSATSGGAIRYAMPLTDSLLPPGLMMLDRCTFYENQSINQGGAIYLNRANLLMTHSVIANNSARGSSAPSAIGSFDLNRGRVILSHCTIIGNQSPNGPAIKHNHMTINSSIIAGNGSGGGPYDLVVSGGGTINVAQSVIGTGSGNGTPHGTLGNLVGTNAAPLIPLLAPLGNYGGATLSMPPLPGSIAINLASTSTIKSDQRGLSISGAPDAGAAEYRGLSDLRLFWETDWDSDGAPFGVEHAVGTNPLVSDASSPLNLRISLRSGNPLCSFAINSAARPHTRWVIRRSYDLEDFSEQIYSFNGPTSTNSVSPGIFQGSAGGLITILDQPPNPAKAFYRLEAVLVP